MVVQAVDLEKTTRTLHLEIRLQQLPHKVMMEEELCQEVREELEVEVAREQWVLQEQETVLEQVE